jgi:hypothetical protein
MLKAEIKPGMEYAFREKRGIREPFQHLRIIELVRGNKWKAKWIEPNPGLADYAESGQLIVLWEERKAFLKEEEAADRLRMHNESLGYDQESPVAKAVHEIFESGTTNQKSLPLSQGLAKSRVLLCIFFYSFAPSLHPMPDRQIIPQRQNRPHGGVCLSLLS